MLVVTEALIGNSSISYSKDTNFTESDLIRPINYYGLIYTSLLFVVGIPGNILVFFVYSKKMRKNSTTIFILVLAVFDLVNCIATLPTEIVMLLNPFVFHMGPVCKMSRFTTYTCNSAAAVILAAIAVDRYKRVCKPHGTQITTTRAKRLALVALTVSMSFTWPSLLIYGPRTILVQPNSASRNVTHKICEIDDSHVLTVYPLVYYSYMCFSTCGIYFILLSSYICIVVKMVKRRDITSLINRRSVSAREIPDIHIENPSTQANHTNTVRVTSVHSSTRSLNVCCRTDESNCFQYERASVINKGSLGAANKIESQQDQVISLSKDITKQPRNVNNLKENTFLNVDRLVNCHRLVVKECVSVHEHDNDKHKDNDVKCRQNYQHITQERREINETKMKEGNISNLPLSGQTTPKTNSSNSLEIPTPTHFKENNTNVSRDNQTGSKVESRNGGNEKKHQIISNTPSHTGDLSLTGSNKSRMRPSKRSLRTHRLGKTTLMLLVVTVVYIVSFLPFLTVVIRRAIYPKVPLTFKEEYDILYEALYRSYLLNCAINPVIYSFCNANFRKDCKAACRRRKLFYR